MQLVQRENIRLASSVAALAEGQIVGLGMLGVRSRRGWIGGMGVVPERRNQGIGRRMMEYLISEAGRLGLTRLQLEVIVQNAPAYHLYESVGFRRLRHLAVLFTGDTPKPIPAAALEGIVVEDEEPSSLLTELPALAATVPPWQHDHESMRSVIDQVEGLVARRADRTPAGLCLWSGQDDQGGILALAAQTPKIGRALLAKVRSRLPYARLNYLNVADDDPMLPVLLEAGFSELIGQHEMVMELP